MPKIPATVERSLGAEAAGDLSEWVVGVLDEHAVRRDEFRQVLSRLDVLEHDVADVKDRVTQVHRTMDERFDRMNAQMNARFDAMNRDMNTRFDRMNERFDRMNERFDRMNERVTSMMRWTVGILALLGTIMTILMAIAQFS